jgi:beta-1,4-mannooligosaccharide/beta-1,4-mannosyl-N-acetylglucosamine phosphorylase
MAKKLKGIKTMNFAELDVVRRYPGNPVLSCNDVPYESSLVFNAGVTKFQGKYVMAFRNDYGLSRESFSKGPHPHQTSIGLAFSDDGLSWEVAPKPCFTCTEEGFFRAYDPRLTVIDGRCYMCFAMDGEGWIVCGGIAGTDDFENFEVLHLTEPDNRNMVLFPEKINGEFVRLDRPFPMYGGRKEFFDTWLSRSPDCRYWGAHRRLFRRDDIAFCNSKTGPGAPPVRTEHGWLTTFHAVWMLDKPVLDSWDPAGWNKIYYGGIMLLDLEDPARIKGICQRPLLAPKERYEHEGFRSNTIFPGGMILEDSGEVKIYYGSGDTVECLAVADVDELIKACLEQGC